MTRAAGSGPARRAFELLLVAAALGLAAFLVYKGSRGRLQGGPAPAAQPVPAAADGDSSVTGSVDRLPRVRLSTPPKPPKRRPGGVPAPGER